MSKFDAIAKLQLHVLHLLTVNPDFGPGLSRKTNASRVRLKPRVNWGHTSFAKANVRFFCSPKRDRLISKGMQKCLAGVEDLQGVHASAKLVRRS